MNEAIERVRRVRAEVQRHAGRSGTGFALQQFLRGPVDDELQLLEYMLGEAGEARLYGLSATEWLHLASEGPDSEVAPCCGDIGQLREYLQVLTTSQGPGESALLARGLLAAYKVALASHDTLNDEKTFPLLHRVLAGARATLEHGEALRREYAESVRNRPGHGEQS